MFCFYSYQFNTASDSTGAVCKAKIKYNIVGHSMS